MIRIGNARKMRRNYTSWANRKIRKVAATLMDSV